MSRFECQVHGNGMHIWGDIHDAPEIKALDDDFAARWARAKATGCEDGETPCRLCGEPTISIYRLCAPCGHTPQGRKIKASMQDGEPIHEKAPRGRRCPDCGKPLGGNNHSGFCNHCRNLRYGRQKRAEARPPPKPPGPPCPKCGQELGHNRGNRCWTCRLARGGDPRRRERS